MKAPVRVLVAERNFLFREGIKALIGSSKDFELADETESGIDLFEKILESKPDVLVIDPVAETFGLELVRKIVRYFPGIHILSISDVKHKNQVSEALQAGIISCLLKECGREEVLDALAATAAGDQFFCGRIISEIMVTPDEAIAENGSISCDGVKISSREVEIIRLVAEGLTNKEIADKLCLSTHTVTTHRKNIMSKLSVNNTAGLVLFAMRNNIISPNKYLFNTN
ncbi:MAG: LuxR family two component transcriptional regulator [Bacteroidetes bacterium]|nr:MAG: LuxR family two component transcriptional regulator [Bacteroidota bacterium]